MYGRENRQVNGRDGAMKWILGASTCGEPSGRSPFRVSASEPKRLAYCLKRSHYDAVRTTQSPWNRSWLF